MDIQMEEVCKAMYTYPRQHSLSLFYACTSTELSYHLPGNVLVVKTLRFPPSACFATTCVLRPRPFLL